jgi:hypothetical protein
MDFQAARTSARSFSSWAGQLSTAVGGFDKKATPAGTLGF